MMRTWMRQEKIVYLDVMDYYERFSERVIRSFGDLEVKKKLNHMFIYKISGADFQHRFH
ncbi:hypothetical protein [Paenibacillus sp. J22TS3]|uniref:hypothetical protein n=1 Tax=Paenibacillus sp. J22TS3 TaxID=2807192 RepID=UPI001BD008A9|nr:hypothetical protein [Paenibacillus sp. J22TS3]